MASSYTYKVEIFEDETVEVEGDDNTIELTTGRSSLIVSAYGKAESREMAGQVVEQVAFAVRTV